MGEYADYRLNGVTIYSRKNDSAAYPVAMEVFRPSDWLDEACGVDFGSGCPRPDDVRGFLGFRTTCLTARKRLDVQGCTVSRAREAFAACALELSKAIDDEREDDDDGFLPWNRYEVSTDVDTLVELLSRGECVLDAYRQVLEGDGRLQGVWYREREDVASLIGVNAFAQLLIDSGRLGGLVGVVPFVDMNPLYEIRLMLEAVPEDRAIEYDCGDVLRYWDPLIETKELSVNN